MQKLTLCAVLVALTACSSSAQQARRPAPNDVVATVGSQSITLAEVDDKALDAPTANFSGKLSQALYDARRAALEEIIASKLMDEAAKAEGTRSRRAGREGNHVESAGGRRKRKSPRGIRRTRRACRARRSTRCGSRSARS